MFKTAGGKELELHGHNVEFKDEPFVRIEAGDEVHWIDTTHITGFTRKSENWTVAGESLSLELTDVRKVVGAATRTLVGF